MRQALMLVPAWPQGSGSGAGVRTRQLARAFRDWGFSLTVASHARPNEHSKALEEDGMSVHHTQLTEGDTLRECLKGAPPELVLFDRFYCEERYSFHVRERWPRAARLLDMQAGLKHGCCMFAHAHHVIAKRLSCATPCSAEHDRKWCRSAPRQVRKCIDTVFAQRRRHHPIDEQVTNFVNGIELYSQLEDSAILCRFPALDQSDLLREITSIHRSDATLVCSDAEIDLLHTRYGVPREKLILAPFFFSAAELNEFEKSKSFESRKGFVSIGTFRHPPNKDSVHYLAREVWPLIRAKLPNAQVRIFGSHIIPDIQALHDRDAGFLVVGHASSLCVLGAARVLLAPLRYGAGLKTKIVDAWRFGTPAATTPIGAEGLSPTRAMARDVAPGETKPYTHSNCTPVSPGGEQNSSSGVWPSHRPARVPTQVPTQLPSQLPRQLPSQVPTQLPTLPTQIPIQVTTKPPTEQPTYVTTHVPSHVPTELRNEFPVELPSQKLDELPLPPPTLISADLAWTSDEIERHTSSPASACAPASVAEAAEVAGAQPIWGGSYLATDAASLAADAVALHESPQIWQKCSAEAVRLARDLFSTETHLPQLRSEIEAVIDNLEQRRARDVISAVLWQENARAAESHAKFVEYRQAFRQITGSTARPKRYSPLPPEESG